MRYSRRPVVPDQDRDFLWELKVVTMKKHIEATHGWDVPLAREFLERTMLGAELILVDGEPAGIFKVVDKGDHIYLAELGLRPEHQGRGLGGRILEDATLAAAEKELPLRLQCLKVNPAHRFYVHYGFRVIGETTTHYQMELEPSDSP